MLLSRSKEVPLLAVGLILLVSGIASHHFFGIRQDKAPIAIEPALFDFGKARQGQTLSHTFRLRNKGKEPIAITKSDSSCSCTSGAKLEGTTIRPGEAVDLPVTLKTGAGDGSEAGRVTYYYRSATHEDAPMHYAIAQVAVEVIPDYRIRPTLLDFGTIDNLEPIVRTILLRPEALADVSIIRASSASGTLTARLLPPAAGEHDLPIEVTFSGRSLWKSGPIEETLTVETNSAGNPLTEVLARARFVAPIEVEPESIVIASGVIGTVDREIRVKSARPVRIAGLGASDGAIRLAAAGPSEGSNLRVRATVLDDDHRAINAKITIDLVPGMRTAGAEVRTVTIPIHRLAR